MARSLSGSRPLKPRNGPGSSRPQASNRSKRINWSNCMTKQSIRVAAGSGFSDDRLEPALELARRGNIDYLVFECLAERTIARETLTRLKNPEAGYSPYLVDRMRLVLPECMQRGIRIVTNMGAANPLHAARIVHEQAQA